MRGAPVATGLRTGFSPVSIVFEIKTTKRSIASPFPLTSKIGFAMSLTSCQSKTSNATALRGLKSRRRSALVSLGMTTRAAGVGQYLGSVLAWAKLDDGLTFHEKIVEAGNAATGVWVRGLAWSAYHLTDGFVPTKIARLVAGESRGALKALVGSRLWVECPGGYRIHDYLKYNPSKAEVLEKREKDRLRKLGSSGAPPSGVASASEPPDPDPDPVPLDREIKGPPNYSNQGTMEKTDQLEAWGFKRYGMLGGANLTALSMRLPIYWNEIQALDKTKARSWRYIITTLDSMREESVKTPPKGVRRMTQEEAEQIFIDGED